MTPYKFHNKDTGKIEDVCKERWHWVAFYNDGTNLEQFCDTDKSFHQFKEIDQTRLTNFVMRADHTPKFFNLIFNPDNMKLVHFYRRITLDRPGGQRVCFYFFGYEKNINGRTYLSLHYIDPNDQLHITDNKNISVIAPKQ